MRDYAYYFNNTNKLDRNSQRAWVTIRKDVDWWLEYCTSRIAKLLFFVLLALVALTLKSFWQIGKSQQYFPLQNIAIKGDIFITHPEDIYTVLAEMNDNSFMSIDINTISQQLTQLPWINTATVTREWPNTLNIELVEKKAAYRWGEDELIDSEGARFANVDEELFSVLPKLDGADGFEKEVIEGYQYLMNTLGASKNRLAIDKLTLNSTLSWELHLESGVVVIFGRKNFKQRAARFAEAFQADKIPNLDKVTTLDFRYNRGFAVKWRTESVSADTEQSQSNDSTQKVSI